MKRPIGGVVEAFQKVGAATQGRAILHSVNLLLMFSPPGQKYDFKAEVR
jgi:hypothetical protein